MKIKIENLHKSFPKFSWKERKWNEVHILKSMNFEISSGSFHGFIGPNGSGKTTTIQALLGIITKDEGNILIDGSKISQGKLNSLIGYIPHEVSFPRHLTGLNFIMEMTRMYGIPLYTKKFQKENIEHILLKKTSKELISYINSPKLKIFLRHNIISKKSDLLKKKIKSLKEELSNNKNRKNYYLKKIKKIELEIEFINKKVEYQKNILDNKIDSWKNRNQKDILIKYIMKLERIAYENNPKFSTKAKVIKMFEEYGISYAMNKNPNEYSSGMKKKILLIHALINNSQFYILDEPAANLDPDARIDLFDILYKLNKEGKTIFICSHILKELEGIVDEVTIISDGHVKYNGPVDKGVDMTKLYKISVGKDYSKSIIELPTSKRDGKKDLVKANSNLERMIRMLENKVSELDQENKELKKEIRDLTNKKTTS